MEIQETQTLAIKKLRHLEKANKTNQESLTHSKLVRLDQETAVNTCKQATFGANVCVHMQ